MYHDRVCRLCLVDTEPLENFIVDLISEDSDILHKILTCLPLKVSQDDELPKCVCNECSCKLEEFYKFRNRALESETKLLEFLKTTKTSKENTDDVNEYLKVEIKLESNDGAVNKISSLSIDPYFIEKPIKIEHSESPPLLTYLPNYKKNYLEENLSKQRRKNRESKVKLDNVENTDETWTCCICFLKCTNRKDILQHYKGHRTSIRRESENGEKIAQLFRCSLCEKAFKSIDRMINHGQESHRFIDSDFPKLILKSTEDGIRFPCDMCDQKFRYMRYLKIHRDAEHPETRNRHYVIHCDYCRQEFTHINSLRRHLHTHKGKREYLCNTCGKALSSMPHLKTHIRLHTGHKPYVCKACGKGFAKKCNLVLHERVHSGERPYVCSFCGKAFSQRSTLVIHERYHSGARPFVCQLCNKGFVAQALLSVHSKSICAKT